MHKKSIRSVKVRLRDLTNIEEVREAIDADTCCVFLEILTNPQLEVANLKAISEVAHEKNVPLVVDSTVIPLYVNYVGLEDNPYHELAQRQFGKTAGSMICIDLESKEACFSFLNNLKLIHRATNLFDNRSGSDDLKHSALLSRWGRDDLLPLWVADMDFEAPSFINIPFASVSDKARNISITFQAPSKTFNIAGIVSSYAIVPNEEIRRKFYPWLSANELDEPTLFAPIATIAAFRKGEEWRKKMLAYIEDLHLSHDALLDLFIDKAHLALNDGEMFGPDGEGFMRLNVATPRSILKQALQQLEKAVAQL